MKRSVPILKGMLVAGVLFFSYQPSQAQLWKKIKNKVAQTAEDHVVNDAGNATNKTIDNTERAAGNAAKGNNNSSSSNNNDPSSSNSNNNSSANNSASANSSGNSVASVQTYRNYDFVPGDSIIFESNFTDEENGEIPSQFTLFKGQIDVQEADGQKVMHFAPGPRDEFSPRMTSTNYMPDQFTIEFDFKNEKFGINHVAVAFSSDNYYGGGSSGILPEISFYGGSSNWSLGDASYPAALKVDYDNPMEWHHVAIAVNKNQGKIYLDQYRVQNVNNLTGKANTVYFLVDGYENSFIKNVRIAAGGIDIYKKVTTSAPIIMHGILFDVDKASLQPESMGSINKIYNLMKKQPDLKFEIDGHTDNTGEAAHNLTLSQQRAEAVKAQLVKMGIDNARLTTKGFGDTKPLSDNSTPEGKANNRRVEFIKI